MCGILYARAEKPAKKILWKRYNAQSTRGQEGYGYIPIEKGRVREVVRACKEKEIHEKLKKETASEILFHHRFPTSTPNIVEATHPIKISCDILEREWYIIHNGIISNDEAMKEKHKKMGISYSTYLKKTTQYEVAGKMYKEATTEMFNDSECLGYEIALTIEGKQKEVEARGAAAVIMLECEKESGKILRLHYVRNNGNPMKRETRNGLFVLKSEGHGEDVPVNTLHTVNYDTKEEETKSFVIPWVNYSYGYRTDEYYNNLWNEKEEKTHKKHSPEEAAEMFELYEDELDDLEEKSKLLYEEKLSVESQIAICNEVIQNGDTAERHAYAQEKQELKDRLKVIQFEIEQNENLYNEILSEQVTQY